MEVLQRTANRGSVSTGYDIDNSVKFEADNTERMYRAWGAGGGNNQTWTLSLWVKRTELGTLQHIWGAGVSGNDVLLVSFQTDNTLKFRSTKDGANDCVYVTNRVFRDTNAWYHIVTAVDTTSGTAGDRLRIYINGVEETSFSTETNFAQNDNTLHNANSSYVEIATAIGEADRFCGYIAEVVSISGSQLAPTTFGEYDDDSGIWIPKKYTGSFPQNSFKLEFKDSSSLGTETSGNGQTFTLQNITSADQATDTPTNNFCTWSPLWIYHHNLTISEGGQKVFANASNWQGAKGSVGLQNGRWYWEVKIPSSGSAGFTGIQTANESNLGSGNAQSNNSTYCRKGDGGDIFYYGGSESTSTHGGGNMSDNNIIGVFLDLESSTKTLRWFKDGSSYGSTIDLASKSTSFTTREVFPFYANITSGNGAYFNFGGLSSYTISSGNADANGYGNFEYSPNDGTYDYYSICTKNLAENG